MPTPTQALASGGQRSRSGPRKGELLLSGIVVNLPTPTTADAVRGPDYARAGRDGSGGDDLVTAVAKLLPTPAARDVKGPDGPNCSYKRQYSPSLPTVTVREEWGKYEPAIRRWEHVRGAAPPPTELSNTKAGRRLNPLFVEWMMGLDPGWVTGFGFKRNAMLRLLGNGVVPQQGAQALRELLKIRDDLL